MNSTDEKLPPWRIKVSAEGYAVTDGHIAFIHTDQIGALRKLGDCSAIWPDGTLKPTSGEVRRARSAGFTKGYLLGLLVGTMAQAFAWVVWR